MNCVNTSIENLKNIVDCHKNAFPDALSSKLGDRFISKMMEWYIISDRGILFHLENEDNELIGFCGGIITKKEGLHGAVSSITQYSFYAFLRSYLMRPWLIFHPLNLKKISYIKKNILLKLGFSKLEKKMQINDFYPFVGLVVICIKKEMQGFGYGSLLLKEFERKANEINDVKKIILSVKVNNINAIKSYQKNDWKVDEKSDESIQMFKFTE
tara:strand:+ start:6178 stop:6816 length:639 start_codon:yes stop_codon:yes gene_type:complete